MDGQFSHPFPDQPKPVTEVQDNPFSNERLSIQPTSHDIAIPLQTLGTIKYANTRAPTDQELGQHPHIVLCSTADWDPHHVRFPSHTVEEENRSTINAIQTRQQYCVEPSFVGTIDDPATFAEWLISSVQVHDPKYGQGGCPIHTNLPYQGEENDRNRC